MLRRIYVRDNLVRVFEDKRYFYDGHGRLIQKLAGKHTAQTFTWDEENRLTQVTTTRRPGTEHENTQVSRFDYDVIGRRVAKHDAFGTTRFIWEGMRLLQERRGASVITYVYEPGSYVPLARLDADGEPTDQGGLGTTDDAQPTSASKTIATPAQQTSATAQKHSKLAANDAESQYWASLNDAAQQTAQAQHIEGWGRGTGTEGRATGTTGQANLCKVYYFHTDQVGMPQELTNAQGQLVWQASYKTWGSTVTEEWQAKTLSGNPIHQLDAGDTPDKADQQQNLRFQGQYLDRETGLHYNTFRYYDPDMGRFICPDPIGLQGGLNLGSYSPNPLSWIDPWGWACANNGNAKKHGGTAHNQMIDDVIADARAQGATNIRKNQQQVDVNGSKVGTNRPDVQYDLNGKHHNVEIDTTKAGSTGHQNTIPKNDPNARNTYWLIDDLGTILDGFSVP